MAITTGSGYTSTYLSWNYTGGGPNYRWAYSWSYNDETRKLTLRIAGEAYTTTTGAQIGMTYRNSSYNWAEFRQDGVLFDYFKNRTVAKHTVKGWQEFCAITHELDCTNDVTTISIKNYGKAQYNTTGSRTSDSTQSFTIDTPAAAPQTNVYVRRDEQWRPVVPYVFTGGAWRQASIKSFKNGGWH